MNLPSFKDIGTHSSILPKRFSRDYGTASGGSGHGSAIHEASSDPDFVVARKSESEPPRKKIALHPNILPPVVSLKKEGKGFYVISEYCPYTLEQYVLVNFLCQLFSMMKFGSKLEEKNVRLFVAYQLLSVISFVHSRLLFHGNLRPSSISVLKDLWIHLSGFQVSDALKIFPSHEAPNSLEKEQNEEKGGEDKAEDDMIDEVVQIREDSENEESNEEEGESSGIHCLASRLRSPSIMERWVNGKMSNFDYLMAINEFAGR